MGTTHMSHQEWKGPVLAWKCRGRGPCLWSGRPASASATCTTEGDGSHSTDPEGERGPHACPWKVLTRHAKQLFFSPLEKKHLWLQQFTEVRRPPHCLSPRNKTGQFSCSLLNRNNALQGPLAYLQDPCSPAPPHRGALALLEQQYSLWPSRPAPGSLALRRGLCSPWCPGYLPLVTLGSSGHAHAPHRHSPSCGVQPLKERRASRPAF